MHICADEIIAVSTALTTALPFIPRVRRYFKKVLTDLSVTLRYFFLHKPKSSSCTCPKCVPCECNACETAGEDPKTLEEAEFERWLKYVAPLLGRTPPPDMAKYPWDQRILRDGSGYLVAGVIYPIYPTPPGSDYYRDREGFRLATAEESAAMREENRS